LIRALEQLGFGAIRQKGSHVRLRHEFHGILSEVAQARSIAIESILELL